jgi:hypothetical protein
LLNRASGRCGHEEQELLSIPAGERPTSAHESKKMLPEGSSDFRRFAGCLTMGCP